LPIQADFFWQKGGFSCPKQFAAWTAAVLEAVQTPTVGVPLPFRKVCRLDPVGSKIILEQSEHKRSVQKTFLMSNNEHLKQCNIKSNCRCYGVQFRNRQEGTGKKQTMIPKRNVM